MSTATYATPFNPLDPTLPRCEYRTITIGTKAERAELLRLQGEGWKIYRPGLFSVQLSRPLSHHENQRSPGAR